MKNTWRKRSSGSTLLRTIRGSIRRGFTVIELIIVLAVISLIAVVAVPALNSILGMEQHTAIKELGQTLTWLQEEASLRNVAFRMEINLDRNTWKVTQGDPTSLIFATPEEAEDFRDEQKDKMKRYTKRQAEENNINLDDNPDKFDQIDDPIFTSGATLPEGLAFAFVYTPQYGNDGITPNPELPEEPEDEAIAYIHVFPDGSAEHAVIRIINIDDEEEGYSLEMEPMGGGVKLTDEIIDPEDSMSWLPDEGPTFR